MRLCDWWKGIPVYPMGREGRVAAGQAQHSASHTPVHRGVPS